jgi:hypothetical protein
VLAVLPLVLIGLAGCSGSSPKKVAVAPLSPASQSALINSDAGQLAAVDGKAVGPYIPLMNGLLAACSSTPDDLVDIVQGAWDVVHGHGSKDTIADVMTGLTTEAKAHPGYACDDVTDSYLTKRFPDLNS